MIPGAAADVGDVCAAKISAAATLVWAAVVVNYQPVTWQQLTQRMRGAENKALLLQALEMLCLQGAVQEVEREIKTERVTGVNEAVKRRRLHGSQEPKSKMKVELQMSTDMASPVGLVTRGGQEAFPKFKLQCLAAWPVNPVLDAVKAEHKRRDLRREKSVRSAV